MNTATETKVLGYARVSTNGQSLENQIDALTKAGATEIFEEKTSGARNARSVVFRSLFDRARQLRADGYEVKVVVVKLDRFSRSLSDLLAAVKELGELGVSFHSLDSSLTYDAHSPSSKLMLAVFGALAEFERELIVSRTTEGRIAAQAKGVRVGRKPVLTATQVEKIREEFQTGLYSKGQLASRAGVSVSTIHRVLGLYSEAAYLTRDAHEKSQQKRR